MSIRRIFRTGSTDIVPTSAHFIEHVYDRASKKATKEVIVGHDTKVYLSRDLGATWHAQDIGAATGGKPISRSFTLGNGDRIVQTSYPFQMFVVDSEYRLKANCVSGLYNWHGTWSIDQSSCGTIMYGEYFGTPERVHIWRSTDGGLTWHASLSCDGPASATPSIRHFHTCQADPFQEGRWIASSGDSGSQNKIWLSENDGITWSEVGPPTLHGKYNLTDPRRAYRFVALQFSQDHIIWPTDDTLGHRKAALIRASREDPSNIEIVDWFGPNEMRALVEIDTNRSLAISEAKLDPSLVDLFLVEGWDRVTPLPGIDNPGGQKTAMTRTMTSKAARDGVFFSFDEIGLSGERSRFARWQVLPDL